MHAQGPDPYASPPGSAADVQSQSGGGGGVGGAAGAGAGTGADWHRPTPYAERRRAGKHTRRVIVK